MTAAISSLPASIQMCFADHRRAIEYRFEADSSFRELCYDFDEVVTHLATIESGESLASELKALAKDLEEELLAEISPVIED